jgi:hypothetical protein
VLNRLAAAAALLAVTPAVVLLFSSPQEKAASDNAAIPTFADSIRAPEQNKVLYELQDRCAKHAAELFAEQLKDPSAWMGQAYVIGEDGSTKFDYKNHYSPRLNKCFALLTRDFSAYAHKTDSHSEYLWDVNAHTMVGNLTVDYVPDVLLSVGCIVNDTLCDKAGKIDGRGWDDLIAPYMS